MDEHRRQHGADPDRSEEDRVERPERTAEHRIRDGALHDRDRVDVDERVAEADDREGRRARPRRVGQGDQCQRDAEQHDPEAEVRRQPVPGGQDECDETAHEPAGADGGVEVADPALAGPEQVERDDDDQHLERPHHERLGRVETRENAQVAVAEDRARTCRHLCEAP